jgi:hypothetical protein
MTDCRGIAMLADIPDGERRDGRPQRVVRREDRLIPMPVLARLWDEIRKPIGNAAGSISWPGDSSGWRMKSPKNRAANGTAYPSLSPNAQRGEDFRNLPLLLDPKPLEGAGNRILADAHRSKGRLDADHDPAWHMADFIELRQLPRPLEE